MCCWAYFISPTVGTVSRLRVGRLSCGDTGVSFRVFLGKLTMLAGRGNTWANCDAYSGEVGRNDEYVAARNSFWTRY